MKFDIIIPVMDKPSLKNVIQHFETLNSYINNLIIVDFNPRENIISIDTSIIIKHIPIYSFKYFNKSLAMNIGFSYSKGEYITFCDADVLIEEDYFFQMASLIAKGVKKSFFLLNYVIETLDGTKRPAPGICSCSKKDFLRINGYSSEFNGWGKEDQDFLHRLRLIDLKEYIFSFGYHISHSNHERTKNYDANDISIMKNKNDLLFYTRVDNNKIHGTYLHDIQKYSGYDKI